MTNAQVRQIYPHNLMHRMAASSFGDDRKGERRAKADDHSTTISTVMPEQRTKFEQAYIAAAEKKYAYIPGKLNLTYMVRGRFVDSGDWVYDYHHVQCAWDGYLLALAAHGVVPV